MSRLTDTGKVQTTLPKRLQNVSACLPTYLTLTYLGRRLCWAWQRGCSELAEQLSSQPPRVNLEESREGGEQAQVGPIDYD